MPLKSVNGWCKYIKKFCCAYMYMYRIINVVICCTYIMCNAMFCKIMTKPTHKFETTCKRQGYMEIIISSLRNGNKEFEEGVFFFQVCQNREINKIIIQAFFRCLLNRTQVWYHDGYTCSHVLL